MVSTLKNTIGIVFVVIPVSVLYHHSYSYKDFFDYIMCMYLYKKGKRFIKNSPPFKNQETTCHSVDISCPSTWFNQAGDDSSLRFVGCKNSIVSCSISAFEPVKIASLYKNSSNFLSCDTWLMILKMDKGDFSFDDALLQATYRKSIKFCYHVHDEFLNGSFVQPSGK